MPQGISLPVAKPEVFDNSILSTTVRCGRKGYYQYFLQRASIGINFPIQFGVAYHKFREVIEQCYINAKTEGTAPACLEDRDWLRGVWNLGYHSAVKDWEDPQIGHKHEYLTKNRFLETCEEAFTAWIDEKKLTRYTVLFTEQAFDLPLPSGRRYGGRFDQIVEWNKKLWIRDFKTTSRMGKTYAAQFDPNNQFTGYVWAGRQLSGRPIEGVIVETVYNTKTKGPEFYENLVTRTEQHIEWWIETVEQEMKFVDQMFENDVWPMRTQACSDYGGCYFREACQKGTWHGVEKWLLYKTEKSVWDFTNPEAEKGVTD